MHSPKYLCASSTSQVVSQPTIDKGRPYIVLNNDGISDRCLLANRSSEQLPFDSSELHNHLLASVEGVHKQFLLQIQLNRYVYAALSARGQGIEPLPYHDRLAITVPSILLRTIEFNHRSIEFQKVNHISGIPICAFKVEKLFINYPGVFINELKAKAKATQARDLDLEEWTQIKIAVNGRARMKPPLPVEYFGNLVLWAYHPRLRVKEVERLLTTGGGEGGEEFESNGAGREQWQQSGYAWVVHGT
ncbi:hypothetical protein Scep_012910 [Stephania cephalantha]|uniref:Uncharacterized protein n=1 Tax=Stephania cephalantha TaxID=152367 RepID=A0AAP0JI97_9MAGN